MTGPAQQERLLVLMPTRRDAERTVEGLGSTIQCVVCPDLSTLCAEIKREAGAALLTEEAILNDQQGLLIAALREEPSWSKFPLIILSRAGRDPRHLPGSQTLNVTLVERPVRFVTLRTVLEAALRHRRHQYRVRDTLLELTRAHRALEQANQDLEQRVRERTQKLQETLNEMEAFSYSVSHDLRAPLRSIEGYAHELAENYSDRLDDRGNLFLSKIRAAATRLDLLVQDVLAYSRVAKGEIQLQDVGLTTIVNEVIESYPELRDKGCFAVQPELPSVQAHPAYLMQCVSNLLSNALKFSRPGVPPKVTIGADEEENGTHVRLWFEDNGIGIAPQHFEEIFQMFGRVHCDKVYEGTGIGLAIVRKAVERMGGSVGLTSELGKGSRFWFSLRKASELHPSHPVGR